MDLARELAGCCRDCERLQEAGERERRADKRASAQ